MRTNLKVFRTKRHLRQTDVAWEIGVSRLTYSNVERGKRDGTLKFWQSLQKSFNLSNDELSELQKIEEGTKQCETKEK